ncbi:MAG: hypothetical protein ACPGUV_11620 [Polyangiales bacterium]
MADKEARQLEILKRFAEVAALAGIRGEVQEELQRFSAGFELKDGRSQMVYVRAMPEAIKGQDAVVMFSPCLQIKKGFMRGFGKAQALELLKENADLLVARYHVTEDEDDFMVWVSADAILHTLDPEEVEAYFWLLAITADNYEKKHDGGADEF